MDEGRRLVGDGRRNRLAIGDKILAVAPPGHDGYLDPFCDAISLSPQIAREYRHTARMRTPPVRRLLDGSGVHVSYSVLREGARLGPSGSFDFAASPKLPAAQNRDLAALRCLHAGESIILYGAVGVGKTHVAQAMGHQAIRAGAEVRFHKTSRILADLASSHADRTFDKRLAGHIKADLLILDDFAMREFTPHPGRRPL